MAEKELKDALDKLVVELETIDQSDAGSRTMLKQLVELIELKLNEPGNKEHHDQLLDKLKGETVHFEVKHPLISRTLEEIVAILVRLGI
jgi:hypothetical protein